LKFKFLQSYNNKADKALTDIDTYLTLLFTKLDLKTEVKEKILKDLGDLFF